MLKCKIIALLFTLIAYGIQAQEKIYEESVQVLLQKALQADSNQ